jgi:TonB-dependent receptor
LGGASALAIGAFGSVAVAQTTSSSASASTDQPVETVVVTGRREAIQSAQKIKENADQIVDAVVADDAGKLPDNSITEVLQRIPGVSITHFAAVTDPDHYSIEGSGVAVRGLTEVNSTLNGRESFSANGGRALLWEDVPPELMAAVSVYKSSTSDQIEGGLGGSIDLRTHMPFDYDKLTINGSIGENYGDMIKQGRPAGSVLVSDRWETGMGDVGVLVDVAYSDISSRADTMQVEPYNLETLYDGHQAFVPGGIDWRTTQFDRKRVGVYEAVEWQPNESLTLYQTVFESYYNQQQVGIAAYDANGTSETVATGSHYVLGPDKQLLEADQITYTGWNPLPCPSGASSCSWLGTDTGASKGNNRTIDVTEGFNWNPSSNLTASGAFQYVHSTSNDHNLDVFPEAEVPNFGFDNRSGGFPIITMPAAGTTDPSIYIWEAAMDHIESHSGQEIAANVDAQYTVSDTGFLRAVRFGGRYSNRTEQDNVSGYNWQALNPPWDSTFRYLSTAQTGDAFLETFPNFFRGAIKAPASVWEPSVALVETYNAQLVHQRYGDPGDTTGNITYTPNNFSSGNTKVVSAYAMADFAEDNVFGMPMDGNVGVRVVSDGNVASGFASVGPQNISIGGTPYTIPASYVPTSGGRQYTKALPSLNVQFIPSPDWHLRFAASQSLTNPSFGQLSASGGVSFVTTGPTNVFNPSANPAATGYGGDPNLKPQISNNIDMSFEWYGSNQSAAHVALFYKSIQDYLTYGTFNSILNIPLPNGTTPAISVQTSNAYNSGTAQVKGMELGATKFFDFLPAPFDGLGADANFTYIDSTNPGDVSCQLFSATPPATNGVCGGEPITHLPVDGLSRYNFNLTGMYEKGPWSARLAYTWRSKYLLVGSGANGTKSLPVFSDSYGQLDFGASYKFNDHFTFAVDGQNVGNSIAKTLMGASSPTYGDQQYGRSWYMSDRRVTATIKFSY